jgi:Flp pilus assembly protein protease CpaA
MIDAFFIAPMLLIGLVCAYTDIKHNKIPNEIIIAGLAYAILLYLAVFFYNYFFIGLRENNHYLSEVLSNTILAIIVSYLLWDWKLWSAGDAKLFMVYSALMPLRFYSTSFIKFFPSINLLINLFIPLVAILILKAGIVYIQDFVKSRKAGRRANDEPSSEERRKTRIFRLKNLGSSLMMFFTIFIFFQIFSKTLGSTVVGPLFANPLFAFLFMVIFSGKLIAFFSKNKWLRRTTLIIPAIYVLHYGWLGEWRSVFVFSRTVIVMWFVFNVFKQAIAFYIQTREVSTVPLNCLKRGDMPCPSAEAVIRKNLAAVGLGNGSGPWGPEGLSAEEAVALSAISGGEREATVQIYKTFSFAPYMVLAAILCMSTHSSLVTLLVRQGV